MTHQGSSTSTCPSLEAYATALCVLCDPGPGVIDFGGLPRAFARRDKARLSDGTRATVAVTVQRGVVLRNLPPGKSEMWPLGALSAMGWAFGVDW